MQAFGEAFTDADNITQKRMHEVIEREYHAWSTGAVKERGHQVNRDMLLCKRIIMQYIQSGQFSTNDAKEAYHVALLCDRGYVVASVKTDAAGHPISATIGRMTAIGHDCYEKELECEPDESAGCVDWIIPREEYYNSLVVTKRENEQSRDKMLATIATGGIALCFGIASYFYSEHITIKYPLWLAAISLWTLTLIGRLISDHIGSRAIDKCIERLNEPECDVACMPSAWDKIAFGLNIVNCIMAVLGIATFAWFVLASIMEV